MRRRSALAGVRMRRRGTVRAVQERVKRAGTTSSVEDAEGKGSSWLGVGSVDAAGADDGGSGGDGLLLEVDGEMEM